MSDAILTQAPLIQNVALVPSESESQATLMFERLARDPSVDVAKLERLIAMQERIMAHNAESAFNVAFTKMLAEIPTIVEKSQTDKTRYAPLEDIIEIVRPILGRNGFSLSFRTEWPNDKAVKVVGILTHDEGHSRTSEFMAGADQTGSKNGIQALGSSIAYGKRYTCKDLLCIVTREEDDDAEKSQKLKGPDAPTGYDEWLGKLQASALDGMPAFSKMWNDNAGSNPAFRKHLASTAPKMLANIKTKAAGVKVK